MLYYAVLPIQSFCSAALWKSDLRDTWGANTHCEGSTSLILSLGSIFWGCILEGTIIPLVFLLSLDAEITLSIRGKEASHSRELNPTGIII